MLSVVVGSLEQKCTLWPAAAVKATSIQRLAAVESEKDLEDESGSQQSAVLLA